MARGRPAREPACRPASPDGSPDGSHDGKRAAGLAADPSAHAARGSKVDPFANASQRARSSSVTVTGSFTAKVT